MVVPSTEPHTLRPGTVRRGAVVLGLTCLALAGCMVGPDYRRPTAPVAERWTATADARVSEEDVTTVGWWRIFDDPALDGLVQLAYRENLTLRAAGLRVLEAQALRGIAIGGLYPQTQRVGASYSRSVESLNTGTPVVDRYVSSWQTGFDAAWELDLWGRFRRDVESADARLLAAVDDYDDVLVSLIAEVATDYVRIRVLEERLALARQNVKVESDSLEIARVRYEAGGTSELDVQQATTLLRDTEATIPELEIRLRQAGDALNVLLAMPAGDLGNLLGASHGIPAAPANVSVGIPADLLRRRPDVGARGAPARGAERADRRRDRRPLAARPARRLGRAAGARRAPAGRGPRARGHRRAERRLGRLQLRPPRQQRPLPGRDLPRARRELREHRPARAAGRPRRARRLRARRRPGRAPGRERRRREPRRRALADPVPRRRDRLHASRHDPASEAARGGRAGDDARQRHVERHRPLQGARRRMGASRRRRLRARGDEARDARPHLVERRAERERPRRATLEPRRPEPKASAVGSAGGRGCRNGSGASHRGIGRAAGPTTSRWTRGVSAATRVSRAPCCCSRSPSRSARAAAIPTRRRRRIRRTNPEPAARDGQPPRIAGGDNASPHIWLAQRPKGCCAIWPTRSTDSVRPARYPGECC